MRKIVYLFLLLLMSQVVPVMGQTPSELRSSLVVAFKGVTAAEAEGGDVSELIEDLNFSLVLIEDGEYLEASTLIDSVINVSPILEGMSIQAQNVKFAVTGAIVFVLVALSALTWFYGSRVFWRGWLYTKKGWVVEKR